MNKNNFSKPSEKKPSFKSVSPKVGYDSLYPSFAFTHIEIKNKKCCKSFCDTRISQHEYFLLLENIRKISALTWKDIKNGHQWHAHEVDWGKTSNRYGFSHLPEQFKKFPAFQFKAIKEKRIFGFFRYDNVFEVVWLDYDHETYPKKKDH